MQDNDGWVGQDFLASRHEWIDQFLAAVKGDLEGSKSLEILVGNGMPVGELCGAMHWYTHPGTAAYEQLRREIASDQLIALNAVLGPPRRLLWNCITALGMDEEEAALAPPHWPVAAQQRVSDLLLDAYVEATVLAEELRSLTSLRGKVRDSACLVLLCLRVQFVSGRPQWQDLANLLRLPSTRAGRRRIGMKMEFARSSTGTPSPTQRHSPH